MILSKKADRPISAALIVLAAIPVIAGVARLVTLITGGPISADNIRFFAAPVPVVIQIVSVILFSVLGAFHFPLPFVVRGRVGIVLRGELLWWRVWLPRFQGFGWHFFMQLFRLTVHFCMASGCFSVRRWGLRWSWVILARCCAPPRLDAPQLCHWPRCSYAGGDPSPIRSDFRPIYGPKLGTDDGRRLGRKPDHNGMAHPQAGFTSSIRSIMKTGSALRIPFSIERTVIKIHNPHIRFMGLGLDHTVHFSRQLLHPCQ